MAFFTHSFFAFIYLMADLDYIEAELKKRWPYPDLWFRKQNDSWDAYSQFIYTVIDFEELIKHIALAVKTHKLNKKEFFYYAINRWYNFWSAIAVEQIFKNMPQVIPAINKKDRLVDFAIDGIQFDLKTSKFPKGFGKEIAFAKANPKALTLWFYNNQSKQKRYHLENRLFLVVHNREGEHYKLKAEISWLKSIVEDYVTTFAPANLIKLQLNPEKPIFSDIIWATR